MPRLHTNYIIFTQELPTKLEGRKHTLRPNTEIEIAGGAPPSHRKEIIVCNRNSSLNLQIRRAPAARSTDEDALDPEFIATVFPNGTFRMTTNATIWLRNANDSGPLTANVTEIYYAP